MIDYFEVRKKNSILKQEKKTTQNNERTGVE